LVGRGNDVCCPMPSESIAKAVEVVILGAEPNGVLTTVAESERTQALLNVRMNERRIRNASVKAGTCLLYKTDQGTADVLPSYETRRWHRIYEGARPPMFD
jgi:hypothetical protein